MSTSPAPVPQPAPPEAGENPRPIVFFDGVCGLCNRFVDFILKHDRHDAIRMAPLQGETAGVLPAADREKLDSVVLLDGSGLSRKSTAVVRVLWLLGGGWRVLGGLLWLVPRPLRNLGYVLVASNRYRLFGRKETCRLPTAEERTHFLP